MTVHFANRGQLDLAVLRTMGVSVKETDSPIGFFGTGLKFAVATLLRTGHRVSIWVGGEERVLSARPQEIRGQTFQMVCLGDEVLAYTTDLGKNWEVWQAYRELASNARDEPDCLITDAPVDPRSHDTCISVEGEAIAAAHRDRATIFCEGRVVCAVPGLAEVREGRSRHVYYRGVRVHTLQQPAQYTYNLLRAVDLTEDRTMKYPFQSNTILGELVARHVEDREVLDAVIMSQSEDFERTFAFEYVHEGSPAFMERVAALAHNAGIHSGAHRLWVKSAPSTDVYEDAILDDEDERMIAEAEELCLVIDPDYLLEARYVVGLGSGVYGMVRGSDVLISHSAVTMGVDFLAATLMEEYLHHQHKFADCTRELQNHIFQQLVRLARRIR